MGQGTVHSRYGQFVITYYSFVMNFYCTCTVTVLSMHNCINSIVQYNTNSSICELHILRTVHINCECHVQSVHCGPGWCREVEQDWSQWGESEGGGTDQQVSPHSGQVHRCNEAQSAQEVSWLTIRSMPFRTCVHLYVYCVYVYIHVPLVAAPPVYERTYYCTCIPHSSSQFKVIVN